MLTVWGRTNSINVQKVMWTVGELGLEHRRIDVGGQFGGLDTPEYRALNPNARVPTIDDDGRIVWESNACVRYLAAKYDEGGLWPSDPGARADADRWMDWHITTVNPHLFTVFWGLIRAPEAERDMAAIEAAGRQLGEVWRILDACLAESSFVAGDRLTMGDIPLGAACYRYYALDIPRPRLPHLEAWYERLQESAAYRTHVMIPLS